jgi:hypothetical protein
MPFNHFSKPMQFASLITMVMICPNYIASIFLFALLGICLVKVGRPLAHSVKIMTFAVLACALTNATAQSNGYVTFSNVSGPASTVNADASGTYRAFISGTVTATSGDAIVYVELREANKVLASASYDPGINPKTDMPTNGPRSFGLGTYLSAGTHVLYVRAYSYNGIELDTAYFSVNVVSQVSINGSTFISQTVPYGNQMEIGKTYSVSVTFKNTGNTIWVASGAHPYRLGSQNPEDNQNFSIGRVGLAYDVAPGGQYTFNFTVTPKTTLTSDPVFQWRMLSEGAEWFGDYSEAIRITLLIPGPTAYFTQPTSDVTVIAGTTVSFSGTATTGTGASISKTELLLNNVAFATGTTSVSGTRTLPMGFFEIVLRATDTRGLVNTASRYVTINPPAPTVAFSSPTNGATFNLTSGTTVSVPVTAVATPVSGTAVSSFRLYVDDALKQTFNANTINTSVALAEGTHTLGIEATNNYGVVSPRNTISIVVAGNVPTVTLTSPASNMTLAAQSGGSANLTISGNASSSGGVSITAFDLLDNGTVIKSAGATTNFVSSINLAVGSHALTLRATNASGRQGTSKSVTVTVVAAGSGPTVALSAAPTNVRVSGTQTATITFSAGSTANSGTTLKTLELFQGTDVAGYANSGTPVATTTVSSTSANWNPSVTVPAGVYQFKLRSTNSSGVAAESKSIFVNVTNSALLGTVIGVRTNTNGNAELFGWACQPGNATPLSYKMYLDAPTPTAGAVVLANGTANVASEPDNAAVQATCSTPGSAHHFVIDLSSYIAQYAGRSLYVAVQTADQSQGTTLPCADNSCTMPGTLRVALTTPQNGDKVSYPNPVFVRMQLTNYSGTYDEVGFFINGKWTPAQSDGTPGAYSASVSGLEASTTPYTVYAKARQGNISVLSMQNQFMVVPGSAFALTSPANGASLSVGTAQPLAATAPATVQSVKFFANGTLIGNGTNAGGTWSAIWTPTATGSFALTAIGYDGAGAQLYQSAVVNVTVAAASGSSPIPLPVNVTPPHLDAADAGTLPGELSVGDDGAATYKIDIAVPPGTAGMQPKLSLNYSSNGPNGMVGLGWSLGGLSTIHRCAKTLAQDGVVGRIGFNTSDRLCLDGMRLFRADGSNPGTDPAAQDAAYWATGGQYRTEIEGFARISRLSNGFKVDFKDGRIQFYGQNASSSDTSSAIPAQGRTNETLLWALARTEDRSGNYMTVQYRTDTNTGEYVPTQVRYGGNTTANQQPDLAIRFTYEARPDAQVQYMGGSRNDLRQRLINIQTFVNTNADGTGGTRVRNYIVRYSSSQNSHRSLVDSVQVCAATDSDCLPQTTFSWGRSALKLTKKRDWTQQVTGDNETFPMKVVSGDFAGDGTTINLYPTLGAPQCPQCVGNKIYPYTGHFIGDGYSVDVALPSGNKFSEVISGDLNGDGLADLVFIDVTSRNWAYCLALPSSSSSSLSFATCQLGPEALPARRIHIGNPDDLPNLVSLRNDGKVQLIAFDNAGKLKTCAYANGSMSCTTSTYNIPTDTPVFDVVPIDLSKQGMTDFYSVWFEESLNRSGVTLCNFYGNTLVCRTLDIGGGDYWKASAADLNGDGLTDLMYTRSNGASTVCLSKENDVDCGNT